MIHPFQGSLVALPTPFVGEHLDLDALGRLVQTHEQSDTSGIVACGTTGEVPTLSREEQDAVVETVLAHSGSMSVMVGVGSNCTRSTIQRAREVASLVVDGSRVDGLLAVTPYYNRPSRAGLDLHFDDLADAVELPIVLYNVPARTGVDLIPQQARSIAARHSNVIAIKEASGDPERIKALTGDPNLTLLCGEDSLIGEFMAGGAAGAINVAGNVLPGPMAEWIDSARPSGDPDRAQVLASELMPFIHAMFVETNPAPVKEALAMLGCCSSEVRPPLAPLTPRSREEVSAALGLARGVIATSKSNVVRG
ncbi:MAG TPA: 4-hydroxy-tetrahydrodipicolinate synthase [Planctomycetota bacterium]|jgi:4-hydroxy-tetrahydrodipicolinate synthase|nr:4-hydroxy-tetrahydrodipicolinate synthase [Planctomycetota bacterium]